MYNYLCSELYKFIGIYRNLSELKLLVSTYRFSFGAISTKIKRRKNYKEHLSNISNIIGIVLNKCFFGRKIKEKSYIAPTAYYLFFNFI